jgi:hypothetical protein
MTKAPSPTRRFTSLRVLVLVVGLCLVMTPLGSQPRAYDGPTFEKGLWLFQRSTEFITRHWVLPNARRIKVEPAQIRCVNPTEAMVEIFRPVRIGSCESSVPEKRNQNFIFAKRCDYLGPVKTVISVESGVAYRETNETLSSGSPKKDIIVARRVGDCAIKADDRPAPFDIQDANAYVSIDED